MILNKEQLKEEAHKSALNHDPYMKRKSSKLIGGLGQSDIENLRSFVEVLREKRSSCAQPAEEWLLDNAEFLEEQALVIKQELNKQIVNALPHLSKAKEARVYAICKDYIKYTDGQLSMDGFISYVRAYQEVSVLTMSEVWSVPMFLRVALINRLAEVMNTLKERHETCTLVDNLLSNMDTNEITPERLNHELEAAGQEFPLSGPMIVHLVTHLRERADYTATVGEWLVCKLENGPESLDQILSYEYQLQASFGISTGNLITSLRKLNRWNWHETFEQISMVEQTLRKEATDTYAKLDFSSRETIRKRVEHLSRRFKLPENLVATQAIELVETYVKDLEKEQSEPLPRKAYVAYYLFEPDGMKALRNSLKKCGKPRSVPEIHIMQRPTTTYFNTLGGIFAIFLLLFAFIIGWGTFLSPLQWFAVFIVLSIPALEWAITGVHWSIEKTKKPTLLLKYDFSKKIPAEAATAVVIPVIWSSIKEVNELTARLELHYLANKHQNLHFALLGDFADSDSQHSPEDEIIVKAAKKKIKQLAQTYPEGSFSLFQRKRKWNPSEKKWMGWERKRGKLVEFVELIKGSQDTSFTVIEGNLSGIKNARYIITLDADTQLPLESAHRMIGTIHYPYNQPRLNQLGTRVIEGYGVLQPRVAISHDATTRSNLAYLWSSDPGIDPYAFAVSDAYQDAFGQGIFTGKGIFDINAFYEVLCDRIPENRVLSHDLLEGGFLRAGLLSDIELIDDHPALFSSYQRRLHRWVRGDWQLLLWLFPKARNRNGELVPVDLSILTRWQIIDNLRRSLLSPSLYFIMLLGVTVLPGFPLKWVLISLATLFLPVFRSLLSIQNVFQNIKGLLYTIGQVMVEVITLPFQTILLLDAIIRTLYRLTVSKRHLLEWVPSAEEERKGSQKRKSIYGLFGGYILVGLFAAATLFNGNMTVVVIGLLLVALWACTPLIVGWLNKPIQQESISFSKEEKEELRCLSKEIWSFYEDYVTEEDNWLPPDNVQMDPPNGIAHRTSPTNIGLYLTCSLAAKDFHFIDTQGLIQRLERTLDTIDKMEKWEGHLYNWYDTVTLKPLSPIYVSTVDSGNFVGCLITVREGLVELLGWNDLEMGVDLNSSSSDSLQTAFSEELTPVGSGKLLRNPVSEEWIEKGKRLIKRIDRMIKETNFVPLYDHDAKLFTLGYHVERNERDDILYDLMASEARTASFISIALGQVSVSHWKALGRTMTKAGKRPVLLSWSATMFEYLMPWLFMRTYRNSLWENTYKAVVDRQIQYAEQRGVPHGISESGFYAFDYQMNYQYRAFGVPGLGFKRGLEQDLVVAPYATILSLPFAKDKAFQALKEIEKLNGRGKYGFYEAIDFTKRRLPENQKHMVIRSFMAHHQGMSFLTLANLLLPTPIYERFHRNKQVQATELLLQERIPKKARLIKHPAMTQEHVLDSTQKQDHVSVREYRSPNTHTPEVNILSNGTLTTVITNSGSGFSSYKGLLVSRWRPDPVMDQWGNYIYIRDMSNDEVWSPSYQPCKVISTDGLVSFGLDKASFMRKDGEIKTTMEISVSPEWNAEIRRITLSNVSKESKVLEVTTFTELALANPIADEAHTAFSKLFIRTSFDQDSGCLVAGRRPREKEDQTLWAAHALLLEGNQVGTIEYDTSRSSFIGRGYRLSEPQSIRSRLRGKVGSVADPAFIMRRRISIKPGQQIQLFAITSVSENREEAIDIVRRFAPDQSVERAFQMAWNRAQIELRNLHLSSKEAIEFQKLAGQVLYRPPLRKDSEESILNNRKGQSSLWSYGISGDRPILLVRIENESQMPFVVKILTGHEYLRRLGILFDLVLLNESAGGYQQNLQESLQRAAEHGVDRFGVGLSGVFAIPANQLPDEDKNLLMAVSRLILHAGGVSLKAQTRIPKDKMEVANPEKLIPISTKISYPPSSDQLQLEDTREWQFFNSWGGFSKDGKEYHILIKNGHHLPAPWINVMANPKFGTFVSEMGTGYTWWNNSREFKLTPWSNDPVLDPPTETAFLRDDETGQVWSMAPSAVHAKEPYKVSHGRGYSRFEHERNGIFHEMMVYVPKDDPIKIMRVKLKNNSDRKRQISLTYYAEWVLGVMRPANAPYIVSEWNEDAHILTAKNTYQEIFREAVAFLGIFPEESSLLEKQSWTADRTEFIGRNGSLENPAALENVSLSGRTGTFNETCGAIQQSILLEPHSEEVVYVLLGCEDSDEAVCELTRKYRNPSVCESALQEVLDFWNHHLDQIQVSTPSIETNILLNGWLLYQSLACRMWARTAFYQAGGAYGFRDQLQDSLAMLHTLPELTRKQILLHAAHQYEEGDVQHWWHEETQRGIRTLFSDDLLWLPYTVSRYIEHTGDAGVLDEIIPFIHSEPLKEGEHERYEPTVQSSQSADIYDHCLRAIDKALSRIGEHGLPLMGVGDWNDGMNLVGANGRGESIWLGWFICDILSRFESICQNQGDFDKAESYVERREQLIAALNEHGWDGQWYRRAFTDSGNWLGTISNEECRIDAIAQSWSVISGGAPSERAQQAMNSFDRELVDRDLSVVRLLTPAFDKTDPSPGYIQGYPPGLRENGAQYTHGVIWGIVAWSQLGNGEKAVEMFNMLNPMNHTRTDQEVKQYVGEPYAMAADVYTAKPNEGHAGWTWYTGAASWMYQAGIEWILGIKKRGEKLYVNPTIPHDWPGFSVTYRYEETIYSIEVKNHTGATGLVLDGEEIEISTNSGFVFGLVNDGNEHTVEVRL
ncbi:GH36-type glycosyl hydrolase domain-containing protein [Niallia sp. Krafla_26]|uniref:GH36-type glycosyl hydrolase domain-containing protein n=1 Tax=Niallia sp. Krafla_26 TaxID=3064703 RepID=UPI003D16F008